MGLAAQRRGTIASGGAVAALTYAQEVLADTPRAYWKCTDGSGTTLADSSGNALTATLVNTPALSNAGPMTGETCVSFVAASSQYATRADDNLLDLADLFTLEFWVKLRSTPSDGRFLSKDGSSAYELQIFSGTAYLTVAGSNTAHTTNTIADTTTWHHLVATKNGTTRNLYIDAADVTASDSNATGTNNSSALVFGTNAGLFAFVDAHMAHVAVYATALSAARVAAHYAARA